MSSRPQRRQAARLSRAVAPLLLALVFASAMVAPPVAHCDEAAPAPCCAGERLQGTACCGTVSAPQPAVSTATVDLKAAPPSIMVAPSLNRRLASRPMDSAFRWPFHTPAAPFVLRI